MAKESKYGIPSLKRDFPNEEACVEFIFETLHSKQCSCGGEYSLLSGRRQYQCSKCRFQIAPTAGTIFHKSPTPLNLWFQAILIFSNAKSGISAKQLQRQLEVTYKCAWRILRLIREALDQGSEPLSGIVEMDTVFIGGKRYGGKNNENLGRSVALKSKVMAAVERGGKIRAHIVEDGGAKSHKSFLERYIEPKGTILMTDATNMLTNVAKGYDRYSVDHGRKEYARGDVHVNTLETFFSHIKRCLRGTFKSVSKQHLQSYLDAFVFHYNNRHSDRQRFSALLGVLLRPAK